ncbi:hypothetical protein HDU97_010444 [Phlyctochytrium planicorne]|nr:hypothetical protein HDU97_010444 [Phlyctochytrium planicorne]
MLGAFRSTLAALGGLVWKRRFRLTQTQKARHRLRLRAVDNVIDTIIASKVEFEGLNLSRAMPRADEMTAPQKYWVHSKRYRNEIKPAHWVPKWTKTPFLRNWIPSSTHESK